MKMLDRHVHDVCYKRIMYAYIKYYIYSKYIFWYGIHFVAYDISLIDIIIFFSD